jgi:release factor glutamine methyltransferase
MTGTNEFYGYKFFVNKNVLVPRPLSEELIDTARKIINLESIKTVADIGTGSGCLAITLKKLFPQLTVYATDISKKALKVAKLNAAEHHVDISFLHGHLLTPLKNIKIDLLIANLPYLDFKTNRADKYLKKEPKLALFAKKNGISYYEQTLCFLPELISYPKYLLFEINERQYELIKPLFNNLPYQTKLANKQIITAERKEV